MFPETFVRVRFFLDIIFFRSVKFSLFSSGKKSLFSHQWINLVSSKLQESYQKSDLVIFFSYLKVVLLSKKWISFRKRKLFFLKMFLEYLHSVFVSGPRRAKKNYIANILPGTRRCVPSIIVGVWKSLENLWYILLSILKIKFLQNDR